MLTAIQDAIRRWHLQDGIRKVVVAVSGGADSVSLCHALRLLWQSDGIELVVAHVEHGIRGEDSRNDARFVEQLAERWGLRFRGLAVDVPTVARATGESLEMAARRLRRGALAQIVTSEQADAVCTGHTLDDQVETLFLRLGRGTGPHGIGGIAPRAWLEEDKLLVLRPLLACRRADLRRWLSDEGLAWREDASNSDLRFLRNRVREQLVPVFREVFGEGGMTAMARLADLVQEQEVEWLVPSARERLLAASASRDEHDDSALDCQGLRGLPRPLLGRVVVAWLQRHGLPAADQTAALVRRIADFATAPSRGTRELPLGGGHAAVRTYDTLRFRSKGAGLEVVARPSIELRVPGVTVACEWGMEIDIAASRGMEFSQRGSPLSLPQVATLRANAVAGRVLTLRPPAAGDRMQPIGGPGHRKLAEMLLDAKVARDQRSRVPVVCCDGEVAWVPGLAVAHRFAVAENDTESVLRITLRRL